MITDTERQNLPSCLLYHCHIQQSEHLDVIARQSAELQELRQLLESTKKQAANDDQQQNLEEKLKQREKEIQELLRRIEQDDHEKKLAEKDQLIRDKDRQLQELLQNDAESIKPTLQQLTEQLEELKKAASSFFFFPPYSSIYCYIGTPSSNSERETSPFPNLNPFSFDCIERGSSWTTCRKRKGAGCSPITT